jgi:DNA invertase Pin-like site-specific DNA recombinase
MENLFGDSPHGQLLAQMQGMIAEYERSQIADRTRRGRLHKARKAEFLPWAYRVYGYRYMRIGILHGTFPPRHREPPPSLARASAADAALQANSRPPDGGGLVRRAGLVRGDGE